MLKDAKASYYSSIISENALDPKILFNTVDKLLHRKVEKRYQTASSMNELTNNFTDFFHKKIATIRMQLSNELTSTIQSCGANEQPCHVELTEFRVVTATEVERFVDKIGKKNRAILTLYQHLFLRNANQLFYPFSLTWLTCRSNQHFFPLH